MMKAGEAHSFDDFPFAFHPRGGLGLLVVRSQAVIRNVTLEPLPADE
jgi:hypothetical protein